MERTTIRLADEQLMRLRCEARRRGVPVAELVREALEQYLSPSRPGERLGFVAVGEGGPEDAAERPDDYVIAVVRRRARHRD